MAERLAVGMVGCGFFAQNHLNSWSDLRSDGIDLVAVCDVDGDKAKAAGEKFGARWYTDMREMLAKEKLGLVDIATRVETHNDLVALAIEARVPTIVQKPFALDLAGCEKMVEQARKANVFLAVHENFRFQEPMLKAAEALRSGVIGDPTWARIAFRTGYDIYSGQPYLMKEKRFAVMDVGVHVLDIARVFMGEAEHISAELQRRNSAVTGEDTATMLVRHRSGGVSVVEVTYASRRLPDAFPETMMEIEGPKGAIVLKQGLTMELTVNGKLTSASVDPPVRPWAERPWHFVQESVYATCKHMADAVRAGKPAATSGEDNLKTFALAEAAYESAASGRIAKPKY